MMEKTFREALIHFLIDVPEKKKNIIIENAKKKSKRKRGIPLFFYRYPLWTKANVYSESIIGEQCKIKTNGKGSGIKNLKILEFLMQKIKSEDDCLFVEIEANHIEREFGDLGVGYIHELMEKEIILSKDKYNFLKFKLISTISAQNNVLKITFSKEFHIIYIMDYLVPISKLEELFSKFEGEYKVFDMLYIRYVFTSITALPHGMGTNIVSDRIGVYADAMNVNKMADLMIKEKELMGRYGLKFEKITKKMKYVKEKYGVDIHNSPIFTIGAALKEEINKEYTSGSNIRVQKNKKTPIDFTLLTLTPEMKEKALLLGYKESDISILFTMYINVYSQIEKKYYSIMATWNNFIKKNKDFDRVKKTENRGIAENITLNKDFMEISEKYQLSKEAEIEEFTQFKNYYVSNDINKKNWIPMWENWIIRATKRKTENTYEVKTKLETDFYVARLVSKDIEIELKNRGVSLVDVSNGKIIIDNIGVRNYPLPPSVGKGETTIFFWLNKDAQYNHAAKYIANHTKKAHEYIEASQNNTIVETK